MVVVVAVAMGMEVEMVVAVDGGCPRLIVLGLGAGRSCGWVDGGRVESKRGILRRQTGSEYARSKRDISR